MLPLGCPLYTVITPKFRRLCMATNLICITIVRKQTCTTVVLYSVSASTFATVSARLLSSAPVFTSACVSATASISAYKGQWVFSVSHSTSKRVSVTLLACTCGKAWACVKTSANYVSCESISASAFTSASISQQECLAMPQSAYRAVSASAYARL